jgi:hypothetical protein
MPETLIYRCENKLGHGPYGNRADGSQFKSMEELKAYLPWVLKHNDIHGRHPPPDLDVWHDNNEFLIKMFGPQHLGWQCGFESIPHLHNWFTLAQRRDLCKKGFLFLLLSTVGEVKFGKHQCVFHRPSAKIVRPLTEEELKI